MRVALYCPNKPLTHSNPSGDLTIAGDLRTSLRAHGHSCEEIATFRTRRFWDAPGGWFEAFTVLLRAFRKAREFRPDLWLTYHSYYKSPDILGPLLSRLLAIPYVLFEPSYGTRQRRDPANRIGYHLNRFALATCRQAFINTTNDLEALLRVLPPSRITYIPPGVYPDLFQRNVAAGAVVRREHGILSREFTILAVARFRTGVKFQSLEYLFKSLDILRKRRPDFKLLVVGDGPMEQAVRNSLEAILPGRAILAGRVARHEMSRYYSAADVFAFPGIGESLGMVYLEAQSCGLPVVALDTRGVPQVVRTGRSGLLVPIDDGSAMAAALERLMTDDDLRSSLGTNAIEFIRSERNLHINYLRFSRMLETIVHKSAC